MPRKYARRMRPRRYVRRIKSPQITTLTQPIRSYKTMSYQRNSKGYLKILRKVPDIAVYNSALNTATLQDVGSTGLVQISSLGLSVGFTQNVYDVGFSIKFNLAALQSYLEITNLCDKYRIKGAYVRLYHNNSNSSTNTKGSMPYVQYVTDNDDATVPTTARLKESMGVKFKTFKNASSYIGMKCRPTPTREIYNTGITTAYEIPKKAVWIDSNSPTVEHYGIKGIINQLYLPDPATAQSAIKFDIALLIEGKDFI